MKGKFVILRNDQYETYYNYDDIPDIFDNLIEFLPEEIPGPHTEEQHHEIETYSSKLKELLKRGRFDYASNM